MNYEEAIEDDLIGKIEIILELKQFRKLRKKLYFKLLRRTSYILTQRTTLCKQGIIARLMAAKQGGLTIKSMAKEGVMSYCNSIIVVLFL